MTLVRMVATDPLAATKAALQRNDREKNMAVQAELREPAWMHPTRADLWHAKQETKAAEQQARSVRQVHRALNDAAQIIANADFPLGSPFPGYDVRNVVAMLLGDFQPQEMV